AARVLIHDAGGHLFVMPFAVEFENKVEHGTRRGCRFFVTVARAGFRPTVVHRLRKICTEGQSSDRMRHPTCLGYPLGNDNSRYGHSLTGSPGKFAARACSRGLA